MSRADWPSCCRWCGSSSGDIAAGNLDAARADWVPAHQQYERLGGAYDAFGDLGDAIDELPSDLPQGIADPDFAGFHRLEYGLWHGQSAAELAKPAADALVDAVDQLNTEFPTEQIDPLDVGLRTHEILEDAVRFELSGQATRARGRRWPRSTRTWTARARCWTSCGRC